MTKERARHHNMLNRISATPFIMAASQPTYRNARAARTRGRSKIKANDGVSVIVAAGGRVWARNPGTHEAKPREARIRGGQRRCEQREQGRQTALLGAVYNGGAVQSFSFADRARSWMWRTEAVDAFAAEVVYAGAASVAILKPAAGRRLMRERPGDSGDRRDGGTVPIVKAAGVVGASGKTIRTVFTDQQAKRGQRGAQRACAAHLTRCRAMMCRRRSSGRNSCAVLRTEYARDAEPARLDAAERPTALATAPASIVSYLLNANGARRLARSAPRRLETGKRYAIVKQPRKWVGHLKRTSTRCQNGSPPL